MNQIVSHVLFSATISTNAAPKKKDALAKGTIDVKGTTAARGTIDAKGTTAAKGMKNAAKSVFGKKLGEPLTRSPFLCLMILISLTKGQEFCLIML